MQYNFVYICIHLFIYCIIVYRNLSTIPAAANLIPYVSLIRWAFEALSINELRGRKFECDSIPCVTTGIIILYYKQFYHFIFLYTYINYEINKKFDCR